MRLTNREVTVRYHFKLRLEAMQVYSGMIIPACKECGEDDLMKLSLDHINGEGTEHRNDLVGDNTGGWKFYRALRMRGWPDRDKIQVLCIQCNLHRPKGPHKKAQPELEPVTAEEF